MSHLTDAPEQWFVCGDCNGSGEQVFGYWGYEPGCGHGHTMEEGRPCELCKGAGGWIAEVEPDPKTCADCGARINPMLYPCFERTCPQATSCATGTGFLFGMMIAWTPGMLLLALML